MLTLLTLLSPHPTPSAIRPALAFIYFGKTM